MEINKEGKKSDNLINKLPAHITQLFWLKIDTNLYKLTLPVWFLTKIIA